MTAQVCEDANKIQALWKEKEYQALYAQYAPVFGEMLFVQSLEEWLDFIQQGGTLEEEPLKLYLSAWRGECLLLGGYEGEATEKVLGYLQKKVPAELLERFHTLPPVIIDIDERDGTLEKQLAPYQKEAGAAGFTFHVALEDIYCAGAYFLSVEKNQL